MAKGKSQPKADLPRAEKKFEKIKAKLSKRGYRYAGLEPLNKFEFKKGRFVAIPDRTKEDILNQYSNYEVELMDKSGPEKGQKAVHVFIKERATE